MKEGEEGSLILSILTARSFASEVAHWNQSTTGTGNGLGTHELAAPPTWLPLREEAWAPAFGMAAFSSSRGFPSRIMACRLLSYFSFTF